MFLAYTVTLRIRVKYTYTQVKGFVELLKVKRLHLTEKYIQFLCVVKNSICLKTHRLSFCLNLWNFSATESIFVDFLCVCSYITLNWILNLLFCFAQLTSYTKSFPRFYYTKVLYNTLLFLLYILYTKILYQIKVVQ